MLNARVRIIGGRNNPDPEDHVQFISTFKDGNATRSDRFAHSHLEAESGTCPVVPVKIEILQTVISSQDDIEVRIPTVLLTCWLSALIDCRR